MQNDIEKEFFTSVRQKIKPQKRKKGINSKQKGNSFERIIAKLFNEKFGGGFARSIQSGSMLGGWNVKNEEVYTEEQKLMLVGDIKTPVDFLYCIECKSYNDISFHSFFSESSKLNEFLNQACTDAHKVNREPMLILHLNNKPTLVMIPEKGEPERLIPVIKYKGFNMMLLNPLLELFDKTYFFKS